MAENTDEESLNNPTGTQSENPPDEIIPANDTESINPNQETATMEVHKHPHHVTHKKKWGEYLLEFLMLFLAVFLGFVAENMREHQVEKGREKEYIQSMIEDLADDTTKLSDVITEWNKKEPMLDTVLKMYSQLSTGYNDTLRRNLKAVRSFPDFIYSDKTMQQLKSSGAMRLIRNKIAVNGIVQYDSRVRSLMLYDNSLITQFYQIRQLWRELFDDEAFEIAHRVKSITQIEKENKNFLLKTDKPALGEFNNSIRDIKLLFGIVKNKEINIKQNAAQLIHLLKKEYHLE
jgi:hypothetical protein